MAKVRFENSLNKMIFEIRGHESFSEMETVLLDFCDETMGANHPDIVAKYPVYYKHFNNDKISYEHTLKNHWHPFYFYKGECEYGFKN